MGESTHVIGGTKIALVSGQGDNSKAVISAIVIREVDLQDNERLHFAGSVEFSESVRRHIERTILPIVDHILKKLELSHKNFEISAVNLGAASALDVGVTISGLSGDTAVFIAMLSQALQIPVSGEFVTTGHIASQAGDISAVKGISVKAEAAANDKTAKHFIYGDLEKDESLKLLSPNQRNRSIDAIMAVSDSVRTKAVSGIGELIREVFTEKNIVLARLKKEFFDISTIQDSSHDPISDTINFLVDNNEKRFWNVLQRYFSTGEHEKAKELLQAFAQFFLSKQRYPKGFGARLHQLICSLPPAVRRLKIMFPALDTGSCLMLGQLAGKVDHEDVLTLLDAAHGKNMASHVETRPDSKLLIAGTSDSDCVVFDAVVSQIRTQAIALQVDISIDSARGSYILESSTVETPEEFLDIIVAFFIHMKRYISSSTDKVEDMTRARTEAIALQQRAFRDKGGDLAAFARARDGTKGGMRTVLDALTEQYKGEKKEAYVEMIFHDAIEALGWDERVRCIRGLIKRAGQCFPEEFKNKPPERFARNYKSIFRTYVKSLDSIDQFLRTM